MESLSSYSNQYFDYLSNTTDDEIEKTTMNQNHIMSNTVEKAIINPDTLSQYKSKTNNKEVQLSSELISELNEELNHSLFMDNLDNSIVNHIEKSEEEKNLEINKLKYLYPTMPNMMKLKRDNSLFKKVINGFLSDNEKPKSPSPIQNDRKPTPPGLSTLYSLSLNGIPTGSGTNLSNGLKSPITPSISSPTIENAVIISSPVSKHHGHHPLSSDSTSPFPFFKNHSKTEMATEENQSIQNLKEIKSKMDSKRSTKNSKGNSKLDLHSFLNVFNGSNSKGNKSPSGSSTSSRSSSHNNIPSFPSYMTSLPLLPHGESLDSLTQSEEDQKENEVVEDVNDFNDSMLLPPPILPIEIKNSEGIPIHSSLGSLSEYNSGKYLHTNGINRNSVSLSTFTEDDNESFEQDTEPTSIPSHPKQISYSMENSYLSQSYPKRNTFHHHKTTILNSFDNDHNILRGSPESSSISSLFENSLIDTIQEEEGEGENVTGEKVIVKKTSNGSRLRFKSQPSKQYYCTTHQETIPGSLITSQQNQNQNQKQQKQKQNQKQENQNQNQKQKQNQNNTNGIRRSRTIYTSTSYFDKKSSDLNKNKTTRRNKSLDTNKLKSANKKSTTSSNKIGSSLRHSRSLQNGSNQRSALSNFLSNFSFTSSNASDEEDFEEEFDNEFMDHSFIKSSASIFSSFVNAEAEKKTNSQSPSVFDPSFIEKVRAKTIDHRKTLSVSTDPFEPSSFNSIIPEPEKLRLLNPIYIRSKYMESQSQGRHHGSFEDDHDMKRFTTSSKSLTLGEMEQEDLCPDQILDTITAEKLRFHLPRRYRDYSTWELIFSLNDHGSSYLTLYDKIANKGPLLMVIKDTNDQVFGAYIPESVHISSRYYGSGECFLWKKGDGHDHRSFKVYEWSGLNELNVLTSRDTIAFGGGKQGRFGLSLDSDLEGGTTAHCDTFKNDPLTISSKDESFIKPQTVPIYYETPNINFECINIEFWKIVDDIH